MDPRSVGHYQLQRLEAADVQPLRTRVLRPHFSDGQLCRYDRDDAPETLHFGMVDDAATVRAVVTYLDAPCPEKIGSNTTGPQPTAPQQKGSQALRLRGMAVDARRRRQGLGRRMLEGSLGRVAVARPAADLVWCKARMSAAAFYQTLGFERVGQPFDIEPIGEHVVMYTDLPAAVV